MGRGRRSGHKQRHESRTTRAMRLCLTWGEKRVWGEAEDVCKTFVRACRRGRRLLWLVTPPPPSPCRSCLLCRLSWPGGCPVASTVRSAPSDCSSFASRTPAYVCIGPALQIPHVPSPSPSSARCPCACAALSHSHHPLHHHSQNLQLLLLLLHQQMSHLHLYLCKLLLVLV
jgi:hypothetical protein